MDVNMSSIDASNEMALEIQPPSPSESPSPGLPPVDEAVVAQARLAEHAARMAKRKERLENTPIVNLHINLNEMITANPDSHVEIKVRDLEKSSGWERDKWRIGNSEHEDDSESEEEEEEQKQHQISLSGPPPKKRRKVNRIVPRDEGYDKDDPFVDDSEASFSLPKYYVRPQRAGFYVASSTLVLASGNIGHAKRQRAPKKPKFGPTPSLLLGGKIARPKKKSRLKSMSVAPRASPTVGASTSTPPTTSTPPMKPSVVNYERPPVSESIQMYPNATSNEGTPGRWPSGAAHEPITIVDDTDSPASQSYPPTSTTKPPVKTPVKSDQIVTVDSSPALTSATKESIKQKKKKDPSGLLASFPEQIQRTINDTIKPMVALESFVPKNKFPPLLKPPLLELAWDAIQLNCYDDDFFLLLTTIFPYNQFTMKKLVKREIFDRRIKAMQESQQESENRLRDLIVQDFPRQKDMYDRQLSEYSTTMRNPQVTFQKLPTGEEVPGMLNEQGQWEPLQIGEPKKKFKMSEEMKNELLNMVKIENDMSELRSEKFELEKLGETWSDLVARKALYGRLIYLWPEEGWITTNDFSRFVSVAKKKAEVNPSH